MSTINKARDGAVPVGVPNPPPLPDDLEVLPRRLRLPHIRRHAPEVVATAKAQRWEPVEVLRALLGEEAAGRERSAWPPAGPRPGSPPARPSTPGPGRVAEQIG